MTNPPDLPDEPVPVTPPLHVGFTSSRHGLTQIQTFAAQQVLIDLRDRRGADTFHHGDCLGGDMVGAAIARSLGYWIVGHPPSRRVLRGHFENDETREPREYRTRTGNIIAESGVIIAFPNTDDERPLSDVWPAVGTAREYAKPRLVIGPGGRRLESFGIGGLWRSVNEAAEPEGAA